MKSKFSIEKSSDNESILPISLEDYCRKIQECGVEKIWRSICDYILQNSNDNQFLHNIDLSDLYELGLSVIDKHHKKSNGQYYTPKDISVVVAEWFERIEGLNICDVACGTGNLILSYFNFIGNEKTEQILSEGRLYLYDVDRVALNICESLILSRYGLQYKDKIHIIECDFLDKDIKLPINAKVISNPPYSHINQIEDYFEITPVLTDTKERYACFIEKIIDQSAGAVLIAPYSFLGGNKYFSLRKKLNNYNGFIVSFDNVPGNIFCGKKYGIFNTNTCNSVRATITVVENRKDVKGFKLTPLIRFKQEERERLLKCQALETFVNDEYQLVDEKNTRYFKCDSRLSKVYKEWMGKSRSILADYVDEKGNYTLTIPNTCRYFTVASQYLLNRTGKISLSFKDKSVFSFMYCLINSSFAYWYWRLYDGGITYPKSLLMNMPVFYDLLTREDKIFFEKISEEMINLEIDCIVRKNNVGVQENIKFPSKYRNIINQRMLKILGVDEDARIFEVLHSNKALEIKNDSVD